MCKDMLNSGICVHDTCIQLIFELRLRATRNSSLLLVPLESCQERSIQIVCTIPSPLGSLS